MSVNKEITEFEVDIIVNASNGIGFMGGVISRFIKVKGVAESINYMTHGLVEKEAKKVAKKNKYLPRVLCGHKTGEIFITSAASLKAKYIIHAVTMLYPGMTTNIEVIKSLLPKIILKAYELEAKTLAIPLLGTGTGKLQYNEVIEIYEEFFSEIKDIDIIISYI